MWDELNWVIRHPGMGGVWQDLGTQSDTVPDGGVGGHSRVGAGWLQGTGCMSVRLGGLIVCNGSGRCLSGMGSSGGFIGI